MGKLDDAEVAAAIEGLMAAMQAWLLAQQKAHRMQQQVVHDRQIKQAARLICEEGLPQEKDCIE